MLVVRSGANVRWSWPSRHANATPELHRAGRWPRLLLMRSSCYQTPCVSASLKWPPNDILGAALIERRAGSRQQTPQAPMIWSTRAALAFSFSFLFFITTTTKNDANLSLLQLAGAAAAVPRPSLH